MARITVEDCLEQIPNRFTLVLVAAERAKQLLKGSQSLLENDRAEKNKEIVTALREIADGKVRPDFSELEAEDRQRLEGTIHEDLSALYAGGFPPEFGD